MPIKKKPTAAKKPEGPKAKLMKLTIPALRKKAKALGVSDYTKRTKENLVQSIILGEARKKRGTAAGKKATAKRAVSGVRQSTRQTGTTNLSRDLRKRALAPGRRVSGSGKVYYERRANRSDKPGQLAGEKYNGWTNYWTWKWSLEMVDGNFLREMIAEGNYSDIYDLSQYLKEEANELLDIESPAEWIESFIRSVLIEINWYEIAENVAEGTELEK